MEFQASASNEIRYSEVQTVTYPFSFFEDLDVLFAACFDHAAE